MKIKQKTLKLDMPCVQRRKVERRKQLHDDNAVIKSMKPPSLGLTPRNMVLLGANIAAASMTRDMLVTKGTIPDKIITSPSS